VGTDAAWPGALAEWRRVVKDGGVLVVLARGEPTEPARRALCAGLADVAQRQVGRTLVTSGRRVELR
jgi:ubiquinone/menaquinone biosynthesis C-methylase UbiE